MSKKTVINIENLNVSSLPASFYQGTYVNRGSSEMFDEEDDEDEVCHCCECENERREAAEALADDDSTDEEDERETWQNAQIVNQGLMLYAVKDELAMFKIEAGRDIGRVITQVNNNTFNVDKLHTMILDLQAQTSSLKETVKALEEKSQAKTKGNDTTSQLVADFNNKLVSDLQAKLAREQEIAEELKKKYLREDNPVKPGEPIQGGISNQNEFSSFLKAKLEQEEQASGKLTKKYIRKMSALNTDKKSKHFLDTDSNR